MDTIKNLEELARELKHTDPVTSIYLRTYVSNAYEGKDEHWLAARNYQRASQTARQMDLKDLSNKLLESAANCYESSFKDGVEYTGDIEDAAHTYLKLAGNLWECGKKDEAENVMNHSLDLFEKAEISPEKYDYAVRILDKF